MNLNINQQALILKFIYESGWIDRNADYYDYIQLELLPQIEKNINARFGQNWRIGDIVKILKSMEVMDGIRNSSGGRSGAGDSGKREVYRGGKRRNQSDLGGRASKSLSKG